MIQSLARAAAKHQVPIRCRDNTLRLRPNYTSTIVLSRETMRILGTPSNDRVSRTEFYPGQLKRLLRTRLIRQVAVKSCSEALQQPNVFKDGELGQIASR